MALEEEEAAMRKSVIVILLLGVLFSVAEAKTDFEVKAGINFSAFRGRDDESMQGKTLGLGLAIPTCSRASVAIELLYTEQGGLLRDIIVRPVFRHAAIYRWDYFVKVKYLELPVLIRYVIIEKSANLEMFLGPSFRLRFTDRASKSEPKKLLYDPETGVGDPKYLDYEFKYFSQDNSGITAEGSGFGANLGASLRWSYLLLEVRYTYAFHRVGPILDLNPLSNKTHALHFSIGVAL